MRPKACKAGAVGAICLLEWGLRGQKARRADDCVVDLKELGRRGSFVDLQHNDAEMLVLMFLGNVQQMRRQFVGVHGEQCSSGPPFGACIDRRPKIYRRMDSDVIRATKLA
jgi:hypothetical protein